MGPRGDVIKEADWCIGEIYNHLEKNNLLEKTTSCKFTNELYYFSKN